MSVKFDDSARKTLAHRHSSLLPTFASYLAAMRLKLSPDAMGRGLPFCFVRASSLKPKLTGSHGAAPRRAGEL